MSSELPNATSAARHLYKVPPSANLSIPKVTTKSHACLCPERTVKKRLAPFPNADCYII